MTRVEAAEGWEEPPQRVLLLLFFGSKLELFYIMIGPRCGHAGGLTREGTSEGHCVGQSRET